MRQACVPSGPKLLKTKYKIDGILALHPKIPQIEIFKMKLSVVRIFFLRCKHLKGSNMERQSFKD